MKAITIIPTYNELNNIQKLIPDIQNLYPDMHILVVDDNSPDGTGKIIREMKEKDSRIHLIERAGKMGLGTAYVEGFRYVIANDYDYAVQMDADYSHDPKEIKKFLELITEHDLVVGSRYVNGVNVINWPMTRLLLSFFANKYSRIVTGLPISDGTGGFKCFRKKVLEAIDLTQIKSNGYAFQIEMNFKAWKKGFKVIESSIVFTDRVHGTSKMSKNIVYEAVFMVWKLRFMSILGMLK